LDKILNKWGVKKLVLVAYLAHVCVGTTARQDAQRGYDVIMVEDGISDRDIPGVKGDELRKVTLAEFGNVFATVVKSAEIE
jgi:nicotinamidase-related amidase